MYNQSEKPGPSVLFTQNDQGGIRIRKTPGRSESDVKASKKKREKKEYSKKKKRTREEKSGARRKINYLRKKIMQRKKRTRRDSTPARARGIREGRSLSGTIKDW